MALPSIGALGSEGLDYFSKVTELIQGDEHRRSKRRQRCDSDNEADQDFKDTARSRVKGPQQSTSEGYLPTISNYQHRTDNAASSAPFRRERPGTGAKNARPATNYFDRGHYPAVGSSSSAVELPSMQGARQQAAMNMRQATPSHRAAAESMLAMPSNRHAGSFGREEFNNPMRSTFSRMNHSMDGHGMVHSESSDFLLNHRQGQLPARMVGVSNSIDSSGTATTFQRGCAIPALGRVASLPSLHGGASLGRSLNDTQRHSWNQGSASDSAASTRDMQQQPACPWAAPWQPTVALEPVVNQVHSYPVPPVPPVPIRGAHTMERQPAPANPWAAPWQPRAAEDTLLGPLGELPPVAELSERSSFVSYPSSLSGRPDSKTSQDTSPLRTPLSGIGPPTPVEPVVSSVENLLENALRENAQLKASMQLENALKENAQLRALQAEAVEASMQDPSGMVSWSVPSSMPGLHTPNISSPLARPSANYSPDLPQATAGLQPFAGSVPAELSRPSPPIQEPQSAQLCARESPNSPLAFHRGSALESPSKGVGSGSPPAYPPSPCAADLQPIARGNDRAPRSPLLRKDSTQRPLCMAAVPVLGPLPCLALRRVS